MKGQKVLFSNAKNNVNSTDEWETPPIIFKQLHDEGYLVNLDLAATPKNTIVDNYVTDFFNEDIDSTFNRRMNSMIPVGGARTVAFCNPPYSQGKRFVEKIANSKLPVVMLVPARTCTTWFHDHIYNKAHVRIKFLRGRVTFLLDGKPVLSKKGKPMAATFPSMLVYFRC